ncbi:MAG: hypothetical protein QXJ97_04555 [Desulfurococcaceae archaeon]
MSVDISIDRRQLLEALLRQYNAVLFTRFSFGRPDRTDLYYKDGWIFIDFRGLDAPGTPRPAMTLGKVHAELPMYGTDGSAMMIYIHELVNAPLISFMTERGQLSTALNVNLTRTGTVQYYNYPENKIQPLLPPGSIRDGDTLLTGMYIWNDGGTQKLRILVRRVDFANRTFEDLVDFTDTITYNYHVVSAYSLDTDEPFRAGIAFAVTGPIQYYHDIAPWLVKYGLPDPKEINPWK